jgi:hypothetical protein
VAELDDDGGLCLRECGKTAQGDGGSRQQGGATVDLKIHALLSWDERGMHPILHKAGVAHQ